MEDKDLNNLGVNEKDSLSVNGGDPSVNPIIQELNSLMEEGAALEQAVASLVQEGVPQDQLSSALQELGYSPDAVMDLFQKIELAFNEEAQAQGQMQQQQGAPEQMNPENMSDEDIAAMAEEAAQQLDTPKMQYGGPNTVSRGPIDKIPRPLYMPAIPERANLINAAAMLSDAAGELFSNKDLNNDGLSDGTFKDWSAKKARFKESQLANRTYNVDYGTHNPNEYVATWEDLDKGKLRTKKEISDDTLKYSRINFDPATNNYTGAIINSENQAKMIGKNQFKDTMGLKDFMANVSDYSKEDKEMLREGIRYDKGKGMFMTEDGSFASYTPETQRSLTPKERKQQQGSFRDIMLGNQRLSPKANTTANIPVPSMYAERSIVQVPQAEQSEIANKPDFRTWYAQNATSLMGKNLDEAEAMYDNAQFKYGGDLPKAQFNIPDNMFGALTTEQLQNPNAIDQYFKQMGQTNYAADTQAVNDAQLQQRQPALGATPLQQNQQNMFDTKTVLSNNLNSLNKLSNVDPTITRKRSLGNAYDQAQNFIMNSPEMQAYGDVSQAAVMGANFANEMFAQKEYNDYRNKLRNTTTADKMYGVVENPVNKRGTFDTNLGLAEPDNLVDYYARAMYGKELYKSGGEFEPHMMFDPVSGEAYEANVEADHNRFAKMGFVHKDEMQKGGEVEVDNDTLAALIAAGADIQIL
jgi:hypothetical protein